MRISKNCRGHARAPLFLDCSSHNKCRPCADNLYSQILCLAIFTWLAVRQATKPLAQLALSANKLGTSLRCEPLAENGPIEVAHAAAAFNVMQKRITDHMAERMQILAAISHDLQTPITRMRLRADLLESLEQRTKLNGDLDTMQSLVEEGMPAVLTVPRKQSAK